MLALPAIAQRGPGSPGGGLLHRDLDRLAQRLELTDEQRGRIETSRKRFRADIAEDQTRVRELRAELRDLWTSGEVPEKDEISKLRAEMRGHRIRIGDRAVDARIEILKILTPEQRKKLGEARRERRRRGAGPGRRGARGGRDGP